MIVVIAKSSLTDRTFIRNAAVSRLRAQSAMTEYTPVVLMHYY
jgi:hypothetical protein